MMSASAPLRIKPVGVQLPRIRFLRLSVVRWLAERCAPLFTSVPGEGVAWLFSKLERVCFVALCASVIRELLEPLAMASASWRS